MPKQGEKARKLKALSKGQGVKPPKRWFNLVKKKVLKQDYTLSDKRVGAIVGGIWSKSSTATKKKIVRKYQR